MSATRDKKKWMGRIALDGLRYVFTEIEDRPGEYQAQKWRGGLKISEHTVQMEECTCRGYRWYHKECRHMTMLHALLKDKHFLGFSKEDAAKIAHEVVADLEPFVSSISVDDYVKSGAGEITGVVIHARTNTAGRIHLIGNKDGLRVEINLDGKVGNS